MAGTPALSLPETSGSSRPWAPWLTAAGVAAATAALTVRDPHVAGSWGVCPTAMLGFACPACGSLRAVHDLTQGDLAAAASSNLLLVLAVPVALLLWLRWVLRARRGLPAVLAPPVWLWWTLGVVVALFTVLRNSGGSWLAP